ncbi:MAG: 16S rRNA (guanine(966)-N(2))-methyltransferase RsmD [Oscillospiraceae bacterium]|nr:16S rRNA (guanine(966)-N(2))-methyltransferase RsmD [Oscillospiraceae bacterium]
MRVISGSVRGRKLKEPVGFKIRPTSDKVKESVFNIIQFDIEGRNVLDLFAGSGQYGIEALSRGAKTVTFVDSASDAIKLVRENVKICDFSEVAIIHGRDALRYLESDEKYDLIFVDPPYDTNLANKVIERIVEFDKLNINGIIICEIKADAPSPNVELPYMLIKEYLYSGVKIVKYTRENTL